MRLLQHCLPQPHPVGAVLPLRQERNLGAGERETKAELARQRHQARLERLEREQRNGRPTAPGRRHLAPRRRPRWVSCPSRRRSRAPGRSGRRAGGRVTAIGCDRRRRRRTGRLSSDAFPNRDFSHVLCETGVGPVMRQVLYAMAFWRRGAGLVFGWGVLVNLAMATVVALAAETLMLAVRGKPLALHLGDCSAVVTAWLLAAALPSLAPWWLTALGVAFAIVVAKHLYGGLGYNPFNPASDRLCGAADLVSTRDEHLADSHGVGQAHALGLPDTLEIVFGGAGRLVADGLTGATPLDVLRTQLGLGLTVTEIRNSPVFGIVSGSGWEWAALGFLAGGLIWLVYPPAPPTGEFRSGCWAGWRRSPLCSIWWIRNATRRPGFRSGAARRSSGPSLSPPTRSRLAPRRVAG